MRRIKDFLSQNERISVMARAKKTKFLFCIGLSIFLAISHSSLVQAQTLNAASTSAKVSTSGPATTASAATAPMSQVIETEVTEDDVFDPEDVDARSASSPEGAKAPVVFSEDEKQFMRINKSLKNLIEENKKFMKQKEDLQKDIEALRGERVVQETRLRALANERADLLKRSSEISSIKDSYEKEIEVLKKELGNAKQHPVITASPGEEEAIEDDLKDQADAMAQPDVAAAKQEGVASAPVAARATSGMANELGSLMEENAILRKDTIKLHYNLANLFFEQGKYDLAAAEYKRVADLMPQDAATHYNLAFVSAEYLNDYKTAIAHYKKYIRLEPQAEDVTFVKNQILQLQLKLQNKTTSFIDKDEAVFDLLQK